MITTCPAFRKEEVNASAYRRAALGRGYADPWLWAPDWWSALATLRAAWPTSYALIETELVGGLANAVYRSDHHGFGAASVTGNSWCTGFGAGVRTFATFTAHGPVVVSAEGRWRTSALRGKLELAVTVPLVGWIGEIDPSMENLSVSVSGVWGL